jgi:hypothetical protein
MDPDFRTIVDPGRYRTSAEYVAAVRRRGARGSRDETGGERECVCPVRR